MERQTGYVTQLELLERQQELKSDLMRHIGKTNDNVEKVDEKVDDLRDIVLPLVKSSEQTAENTKNMATSLDKFVEAQRATNSKLYEKQNTHDVAIERLTLVTGEISTKKKLNAGIIVATITGITTVVAAIIAVAPKLFGG